MNKVHIEVTQECIDAGVKEIEAIRERNEAAVKGGSMDCSNLKIGDVVIIAQRFRYEEFPAIVDRLTKTQVIFRFVDNCTARFRKEEGCETGSWTNKRRVQRLSTPQEAEIFKASFQRERERTVRIAEKRKRLESLSSKLPVELDCDGHLDDDKFKMSGLTVEQVEKIIMALGGKDEK